MSTDTSVVKFSRRFLQWFSRKFANRQTKRQMFKNFKCQALRNLLGGVNNSSHNISSSCSNNNRVTCDRIKKLILE